VDYGLNPTSSEISTFLDPATLSPSLNPILVTDGAGLEKVRKYLSTPREFVIDYETNVVPTFYRRRARTLQLGDKNEQYIIDLLAFAGSKEKLILAQGGYRREGAVTKDWWTPDYTQLHPIDFSILEPVVSVVRPSFESDTHLKIGHNLEFEYIVSKWCLGLRPWHFYDTIIGERILHNGLIPAMQKDFYGLDDCILRYFKFRISKEEQTSFDLETPLTNKQIVYAAVDIRLPWALKAAQEPKIIRAQLGWTHQIENDVIPAFGDMHLNGLYVNPEKWQKIIDANQEGLAAAIVKMDSFFLPIVGRKRGPDPERTAVLRAEWEALGDKSYDETILSNQIRLSKKDPELLARLKHERQTLELRRDEKKAEAKQAYQDELRYVRKKYTDEFEKMEGQAEINYNSNPQIRDALLAGPFGISERELPDTSDKTLEKFADLSVVAAVRDYRGYKKALGTYGDRWILTKEQLCTLGNPKPGYVDPDTGRIHAAFRQLGTETGRPSCTSPNVLNLPQDKRIRESFESRPGYDMVTKDCAGQELVVLTEYSGEPSWVHAFNNKQDPHSMSTELLRSKEWKEGAIHKECTMIVDGEKRVIPPCAFYYNNKDKCKCPKHVFMRNRYKAVTLGLVMGKEAYSLGVDLHISTKQAQDLIDEWMNAFPKHKATIQRNQDLIQERGEGRTLGGRRRIMRPVTYEQAKKYAIERFEQPTEQQINNTMAKLVQAMKREGANLCYQGSSADFMKLCMGCGFDKNGDPYLWHILEPQYGALLLSYIYDELLTESPEQHSETVSAVVSDGIIRAGAELVKKSPMKSDGKVAKTWSK
jgi:DNA polymerase I-like protein with 3'-5' exonuclease and polymerase domains